jgi:hypothetical protein
MIPEIWCMTERLKDYLHFTRKERFGILILVIIILVFAVAPAFFHPLDADADTAALSAFRKQIVMLERIQPRHDQTRGGSFNPAPGPVPPGNFRLMIVSDQIREIIPG